MGEAAKITCRQSTAGGGSLLCSIHNGSSWTIRQVEVAVWDAVSNSLSGRIRARALSEPPSDARLIRAVVGPVSPLAVGTILVDVGWGPDGWKLTKYLGTPTVTK